MAMFARIDQAILGLIGLALILTVIAYIRRARRLRPRNRFELILRECPLICGRTRRVSIVGPHSRDSTEKLKIHVVCVRDEETLHESIFHVDCNKGAAEFDLILPEGLPETSFDRPRISWLLHAAFEDTRGAGSWQIPVVART